MGGKIATGHSQSNHIFNILFGYFPGLYFNGHPQLLSWRTYNLSSAWFLDFGNIGIWGWFIHCCGDCLVYYKMISSKPGIQMPEPHSDIMTNQNITRYYQMSPGGYKSPLVQNH